MPTNVPAVQFTDQGLIVPAESDVLNGRLADFNTAFGGNVNPALTTPQGQLASSEAACISQADSTFLFYTTQIDPAFASGRMQDAIGNLYATTRKGAIATSVQCTCVGLPNVVIPAGNGDAQAADEAGNKYTCVDGGVIGANGSVSLAFANVTPGPIPCPSGTLDIIYQAIPGWDTIINPLDGVIGRNTETRSQFEFRRQASVAWQGLGSLPSIKGSVMQVDGVIDAFVTDNNSPISQLVGGVLLQPNSLYVCVAGGAAQDIANAIWRKKMPGCAFNGTTTVIVQDKSKGYVSPYPSYNVSFSYATPLPIIISVTIASSAQVPSDALTQIQNAIIAAFTGDDGGFPAAGVGRAIFASRFYTSISSGTVNGQANPFNLPWATIVEILIGSTNQAAAFFTGSVSGSTLTVSSVTSGIIANGQTLIDTTGNIPGGTTIQNGISGTGGTGTYALNKTIGSISSELIYGVTPSLFSIQPTIGQIPTIAGPNIALILQ
jgi:Baseplate J-like protein